MNAGAPGSTYCRGRRREQVAPNLFMASHRQEGARGARRRVSSGRFTLLEIPPFPAHRLLKAAGSRSVGPCPVRHYSGQGRRTRCPSRILIWSAAWRAAQSNARGSGLLAPGSRRDERRFRSPRFKASAAVLDDRPVAADHRKSAAAVAELSPLPGIHSCSPACALSLLLSLHWLPPHLGKACNPACAGWRRERRPG